MGSLKCVLLLLWIRLTACSVPFEDCGSAFDLWTIDITGCDSYPCVLRIGSTVNVTVDTLSHDGSSELQQEVYFVVNRIHLTATVTPNPCHISRDASAENTCGVQMGQHMKYRTELMVTNVPPLRGTLYSIVTNEASKVVVCYKVTVVFTN